MSTIIQCPNCATRYRLKFTIEDGQQVRCPACQTVWRFQSEPQEEMAPEPYEAEPSQDEAPAAHAAAEEPARQEVEEEPAEATHANYDNEQAAYQSDAKAEEQAYADEPEEPQQAVYPGFEPASELAAELEQQAAETAAQEAAEASAQTWAAKGVGEDFAFEDRSVDFIRGSAIAPFAPAQAEEPAETANWAAELAGAINRAGYESRDPMRPEAVETDVADGVYDNSGAGPAESDEAIDTIQAEDENQRLAAEKLSAFWRGERAATALEEEELTNFGGGMPVKQAEEVDARPRGGLALVAAWGSYAAVMSGALAAIVLFPEHVVEAMPGAATYYEQIGMPVVREPLGFENVTYEWLTRNGRSVLEVRGDVINLTESDLRVPLLHISVRDDQAAEIAKTVAIIVKEPLAPAARTEFTLEFLSPPKSISGIELQFGS